MLVPVSSRLHGLSGYVLVPTNKYVFVTKVKTTSFYLALLVLEIICKISLLLTIRDGIHLFIKIRGI